MQEWEELNNLPVVPVSSIIGDAAYLYGPDDSSLAGGEALLDIQVSLLLLSILFVEIISDVKNYSTIDDDGICTWSKHFVLDYF